MPNLQPIRFDTANVDITVEPPADLPEVAAALINNRPFPEAAFSNGAAIALGAIKASASGDIKLDKIKFSARAGASAGFGVYRSPQKLFDALKADGMDEPMIKNLTFPDLKTSNLIALRWGYSAEGSIGGKLPNVAFGAGIGFGASGQREGFFAVVRAVSRAAKSLDALGETINSWKMPGQVSKPGNLAAGTWVISEIDGAIKFSLGLEYGYDFNWAREAIRLGSLSGDVGLKIEMGVKAALGFNAAGRYALIVCREDAANKLRLRVFKLKRRGWNFAFDASLFGRAEPDAIPDNFDEFIKGVFNLHGQQVLKDFEKWLDPNVSLANLVGEELVEQAKDLIEKVTGFDPDADFDQAFERLRDVIERWRDLPPDVTGLLYDFLKKGIPLDELESFLNRLIALADEEELKNEILDNLRRADFFETAVGKWLTAIGGEGILSLLDDIKTERENLRKTAAQTLEFINGSAVERTFKELQQWTEKKLGLDKIFDVIDEADFARIDGWLKKRLSDFLGETITFRRLEDIKAAVVALRTDAGEFYKEGYAALTQKYQAEFHFAFQKATAKTALIDATFDFDANAANVGNYFKDALNGEFNEILSKQIPGVRLNKGVLTHEIKRNTHVEIGLPYFKRPIEHINESLAEGEAVEAIDGKLWLFNLKARDVVKKKNSLSKLSIALNLTENVGVRRFGDEKQSYDYVLRLTKSRTERRYFEDKIDLLVKKYLPTEFSDAGESSFSGYLTALDKSLDALGVAGDDSFGNTLACLSVSLPGEVFTAWKKAPANKKHPVYAAISRRVQELLREFIPLCYLQDAEDYKKLSVIYPLLAYSSLPPMNKVKLTSGGLLKFTEDQLYWDSTDEELRSAVFSQHCAPKLRDAILPFVRSQLSEMPGTRAEYEDGDIGKILSLRPENPSELNFNNLIYNEREIIEDIVEAGRKFREFHDAKEFDEAVEALAEFGAKLTDAFNDNIGGIYNGAALRPLGSLIFLEATKILEPNLNVRPSAMLEMYFLKNDSSFVLKEFLEGKRPAAEQIALQQRIVNAGAARL